MKRTINFGVIFFFLISLTSCNGQTKSETESINNKARNNKIVGGGCDGCELMYVGMPKNIQSVDTSSAWNEKGQRILIPGHTIFPWIKSSFYTELDPMKKQVPGWHEVFYQKDIIRFPS